jgi:hypothetical protein
MSWREHSNGVELRWITRKVMSRKHVAERSDMQSETDNE